MTPDDPLDASPEDGHILAGLEHAVNQARHVNDDDATFDPAIGEEAPATSDATVDSSAVMDVLRHAVDRYAESDREADEWQGPPLASFREPVPHPAELYRRDRRRKMAAAVIFLFVLGGAAYATVGGGASKVNTGPIREGQAVTTTERQVTTLVPPLTVSTTEPPSQSVTPTTARRVTPTTARPATTTETTDTVPDTTDTTDTVPDTTTTTSPCLPPDPPDACPPLPSS